jgi:hypothetical protein
MIADLAILIFIEWMPDPPNFEDKFQIPGGIQTRPENAQWAV